MKTSIQMCLALIVFLSQGRPLSANDDIDEITRLSDLYDAAVVARDAEALARIIDDDAHFVSAQHGSRHNKQQWIEVNTRGPVKFETTKTTTELVRIFGDTAIQLGVFEGSGKWHPKRLEEGKPFRMRARFTVVWVRKAGKWRLTAEQSTAIEE